MTSMKNIGAKSRLIDLGWSEESDWDWTSVEVVVDDDDWLSSVTGGVGELDSSPVGGISTYCLED